jgi:hypothetical protein
MSEEQSTTVVDGSEAVEFRDIPGWPGYRVGSDGSVWSCWRRVGLGIGLGTKWVIGGTWRRLQPSPRCGYPAVTLRRDGKSVTWCAHQLVMLAFVGPPPPGMEVAHENGIRADCRLSNLSYKTEKDNQQDSFRHGTKPLGERSPNAKVTAAIVLGIRAEYATGAITKSDLARKHGLSRTQTRDIIRRKSWAHV